MTDSESSKRAAAKRLLGVAATADNGAAHAAARVVVLAVTPQVIDAVIATRRARAA